VSNIVDIAQVVTAAAAVVAVLVSATLTKRAIGRQDAALRAHWNIEGAMWAAQWRDHVLALHDRGLSTEQIRELVSLEEGQLHPGKRLLAAEEGSGSIDDIVRIVAAAPTTKPRCRQGGVAHWLRGGR
jgi:hypothetical protein